MPWRECYQLDDLLRFVARLPEGEKMAVLCQEFDISRKSCYKIFARYQDCGPEGPDGTDQLLAGRDPTTVF